MPGQLRPFGPPSDRVYRLALGACVGATAAVLAMGGLGGVPAATALLVAAFAGFAVVLASETHRRRLSARVVMVASGGLLVLAVAVPPLASRDVWAYAMYGRVVAGHGASPYTHPPSDFPDDPWYQRMDRVWRQTPSVYGPLFSATSAGFMELAGSSPLVARLCFQSLAALAVAGAALVVYRRTRDPAATALVGLNPFVIVELANGAHNDALVGLGVLLAVVLAGRGRGVLVGLALGAAALVKLPALLALVAIGVWLWARRGWRASAAALVVGVGLVGGGYLLAGGPEALAPLQQARLQVSGTSIWNKPKALITLLRAPEEGGASTPGTRTKEADQRTRAQLSVAASAASGALALLVIARRRRDPSAALVTGGAMFAYVLVSLYVLPWYLAWGLFALALHWRCSLSGLVVAHAAALQLAYVPDLVVYTSGPRVPKPWWLQAQLQFRQIVVPVFELVAVVLLLRMLRQAPQAQAAPSRKGLVPPNRDRGDRRGDQGEGRLPLREADATL